jgi:hypothetical protein
LSTLGPVEEEEITTRPPEADFVSGSAAAFMTNEEESAEEDQATAEETGEEEVLGEEPTWLEELKPDRDEVVPPVEREGEEIPALEKSELPDWLVNLQMDQNVEVGKVEELPDWLAEGEQEVPTETGETLLPDWLSSLEAQEAEAGAPVEELPQGEGSLEGKGVEESSEFILQEVEEKLEGEQPPEWISELEKEFSPEAAEERIPPLYLKKGRGRPLSSGRAAGQPDVEESPEWLAELEKQFSSESVEESVPALTFDEEEFAPTAPEPAPFIVEEGSDFLESVPEWAAEVSLEEGAEGEEEEPMLEEAEVPSWLEAMRPVESIPLDLVEEEDTSGTI